MRTFAWLEPDFDDDGTPRDEPLEITCTEAEIIENYYPHWCDNMRRVGKGDQLSHAHCIEDFIVVHWAREVKHDS